MRILLLSNSDENIYKFRRELVERLTGGGNEIILVCPFGRRRTRFEELGCECVDISIQPRGTDPVRDFKLLIAYDRIIRKYRPDVVLTYTSKCSIYGGMACRFRKVPCIVNNSGLMILPENKKYLGFFISILYRLGNGKSSCMMYQNSEEMKRLGSILPKTIKGQLIPGSGVNLNEYNFSAYPETEAPIVFNYVARVMQGKGIEEFLTCARVIKAEYPQTEFRIFGTIAEPIYKERISELEQEKIVRYFGEVPDMKPYIESAHAIIHPSHSEGMTNVCQEHSAMGRICITSDIPGCREIVDNGVTGYLFRLKDTEMLAKKIRQFLALSYEEKAQMGVRAREKMEREFDRELVISAYVNEIFKE